MGWYCEGGIRQGRNQGGAMGMYGNCSGQWMLVGVEAMRIINTCSVFYSKCSFVRL